MRCIRSTVAAACFVVGAVTLFGGQKRDADGSEAVATERWEATKLVVARESVASGPMFFRSLRRWSRENAGNGAPDGLITVDADATTEPAIPADPVIHIRGNLATTLRVDGQSEVVVGGSVLKGGRIDADGIAVVHVQGNVEGTIACTGMASVWVGGDLRGEVVTGHPSMHLHVKGDLLGTIRPASTPALLYVEAGGHAPSAVLAATDRYRYTDLQVVAGTSDLAAGIHRLWLGRNGFVAVDRAVARR